MSGLFAPNLQVRREAVVRRVRELPVPGEILVREGATVTSDQIVARAELPGELMVLRVAEQLGIEPAEVMRGVQVKPGQRVSEGECLCEHAGIFGLFRSRFFAPAAGTIDFITERTGHIGLRLPSRLLEVRAWLAGEVVRVEAGKAATIESRGAFIQGIFGVGGERSGRIHLLPVGPETVLTPAVMTGDLAGRILVGGTAPEAEAIRAAAALGAVGLVTGAIDDRALAAYLGYDLGIALTGDENIPLTLIITEGFGRIGMSPRILEILGEFAGCHASITGATQVRAGALRPEILIPHGGVETGEITGGPASFSVGGRVRLIRVPYFGQVGTITALPHEARMIDTGAHARVLTARLEDGREVTVPRANVELL